MSQRNPLVFLLFLALALGLIAAITYSSYRFGQGAVLTPATGADADTRKPARASSANTQVVFSERGDRLQIRLRPNSPRKLRRLRGKEVQARCGYATGAGVALWVSPATVLPRRQALSLPLPLAARGQLSFCNLRRGNLELARVQFTRQLG